MKARRPEAAAVGRALARRGDEPRAALARIAGSTAFCATCDVTPSTPQPIAARPPARQLPSASSTTAAPPRVLDRWAASRTAITRRTDAGVTASGSPRCRWSARFRWNAYGCSSAGGSRVSLIP